MSPRWSQHTSESRAGEWGEQTREARSDPDLAKESGSLEWIPRAMGKLGKGFKKKNNSIRSLKETHPEARGKTPTVTVLKETHIKPTARHTSHGQTGSAGEDVGKVGPSLEMTQRLGRTGW